VAGHQKKAQKEGRTIVFIDESGLSQRPHRCRTWAPRGQTPILQYHFNWKTISVAAGMTLWNFYFQLFDKTIAKEEVVVFLSYLVQRMPTPLLIVWDRLPAHKSRLVDSPTQEVNSPLEVTLNGKAADVLNKIGWPGTTDAYRVDIRVPDGTAPGMAALRLTAAFIPGREVRIPVQ
jgi:hypothetical protein